jgi:transposase
MWQAAPRLVITHEQRRLLESWARGRNTPQKLVLRARICLLAASGCSNNAIAAQLGVCRPTVLLWRKRFSQSGASSLPVEKPRPRSLRRLDPELEQRILEASRARTGEGRGSATTREIAKLFNVSHSTVGRLWKRYHIPTRRNREVVKIGLQQVEPIQNKI